MHTVEVFSARWFWMNYLSDEFSAENPKIIYANGIEKHHLRRKYYNKLRNYGNFYTFAQKILLP
jgi:hypothetical protein